MEKYIKKYMFEYDEDKNHNKKDVKRIINELDENVIKNLYDNMKIMMILEKIILNFSSGYDTDELKNKIMCHGVRVYNNAKIIVSNLENKKIMYLSNNDKRILYLACICHDIGKIYSKNNHHFYSVIILEYILNKLNIIKKEDIKYILEPIYFHSSKTKHKSKISQLAKILRDADLFDENCGQSLLILLVSNIKNKHNNLNFIDYKKSTRLLKEKMNPSYKAKIEEKINIESNKKLYNDLLWDAMSKYYEIIQPFECEQDNDPYYYNSIEL